MLAHQGDPFENSPHFITRHKTRKQMHETNIYSPGDKTMSVDPMSIRTLGLQSTLRELSTIHYFHNLLLVLTFADEEF